ncbi:hypothetical protein CF641_38650 [Burkholderia pseudomallei]|uniref:GlcG/HbpS family heme-binding protein n=1 Tax=Burkholderia pseudomallei TaxID=28450 RepID=UPI000CCE2077|nr:heme-binding protein [Burkholderia pseudomallei]PNW89184.1 hypothetical protein CF641_38650 [Burkholderia pseudomallei]
MSAGAVACAAAHRWAVTIALVDARAHLLHRHRLDGAAPSTVEIEIGKGRTAARGRRESKVYEDIVLQGRISFLGVPPVGLFEGGVPLVVNGETVAASRSSGLKSDEA